MYDNWEELENSIANCKKCKLCQNRTNIVFGIGNKNADIMLIGEGPGADEDKQGIPFVGKAGQLMNKAFEGLGIDRGKVYIANIVKCRPPANRVPENDETEECLNYLRNQVILVKPKIIVLLGNIPRRLSRRSLLCRGKSTLHRHHRRHTRGYRPRF